MFTHGDDDNTIHWFHQGFVFCYEEMNALHSVSQNPVKAAKKICDTTYLCSPDKADSHSSHIEKSTAALEKVQI